MKKLPAPLGAALALALLVSGCATDGRTARIQEKSAAYATLTPEQKQVVESGAIEVGYTADMVYMALGTPQQVKAKNEPEGKVEMWTYVGYSPTIAASSLALNNPNARYTMMQTSSSAPGGPSSGRASTPGLAATNGGPTAYLAMDLPDIPSHTLYVFLFNGKVFNIKINHNS